jgi:hypothetical protein
MSLERPVPERGRAISFLRHFLSPFRPEYILTFRMKVQVNSDRTIAVDTRLVHFVEAEANRVLSRFARRLTRVEVHLSDVNGPKTGQVDKRCMIEARPKSARPRSATAKAATLRTAVAQALGKMRRSLTTFFDKRRTVATARAPKVMAAGSAMGGNSLSHSSPRKKGIYQARRKSWPAM